MLQSIRDRLTGPVVWFVVALIAVPFAFWGIQSFRSGDGDPVVAKVGSDDITTTQFRRSYEQRYAQYRSMLGENFRPELFDENRFRQLTLDDLVQQSALQQFVREQGYRASDDTLRDFLLGVPAFQKDGKFSASTYHELLQRQNLQAESYESRLRQSLAIDQMRGAVQETAFATPVEAWAAYRLEGQLRKVAVATVAAAKLRDRVQVEESQIADRYERDQAGFRSVERVKLAYLELDRGEMAPADAPAPEVLKAIYDAEKQARFSTVEERHARHILIGFGADKAAAKARTEQLLEQIRSGADFAKLAGENSEDPGSKSQGGDLGWVTSGMMVPAFDQALFGLKDGELTGPVETEFGWHIIRLDQTRPARIKPFEEADVQSELLEVYRTREAEKRFQDLSGKLEQMAFENTTLEPLAKALKLEVKTTDWITRDHGDGIAAVDAVRTAAFSADVLQDGLNSKPIPRDANALVVVHKSEYEPARQLPLDEVRDRVRQSLVDEGAAQLARESADSLLADVKAGKTLREAAGARGIVLSFEGEASRNQAGVPARALEAAFRLPRPQDDKPRPAGVVDIDHGDVAVVELSAVRDPDRPGDAKSLDNRLARLQENRAGAEFGAYQKAIEAEVKVKIVRPPEPAGSGTEPGL